MTAPADATAEALQRALHALQRMQARLESVQQAAHEPIAIVGLACRFPGADGPQAFADRLLTGRQAVGTVPDDERAAAFADDDPALRRGGFLDDIAGFDAGLFDIGDDEAVAMDPHQRLLLETAWAALEDAGAAGGSLAGSRTGVYLGLGAQNSDFSWWQLNDPARLDAHAIPGSFHSLMPGRLSYLLDLKGPSLVVDAACASGLVAVHLGCQALRRRECDAAVAAAVNLVLSPLVSRAVQRSGLLSPTGTCRAFDDAADGFVRGEGAGALVLKRLSDAVADGDAVWAVIHGSAVGQDGRSNGLTAPNGPAQEAVLRQALADARLEPGLVGYVEAHATGTRLGDAIEAQALASVYGGKRAAPLLLGALKPNLGHLEAASGMAALVKAVLARRDGVLPPTRRHGRLNRDIEAEGATIRIVVEPTEWPAAAPYAGVSAFGMSGTNAHLILGPAPLPPAAFRPQPAEPQVLCLSARTETALGALVQRVADALTADMAWGDVCATLNLGRRQFPHRCVVEATDTEDGRRRLRRYLDGHPTAPSTPLGIDAAAGRTVDWLTAQGRPVRRLRLPTYPFERRRYWPDRVPAGSAAAASVPALPGDFLHRLDWQPVPAAPEGRSGGELLLLGNTGFAERVTPGLERAGWRIVRLSGIDDWRLQLERRPEAETVYLVSEAQAAGPAALQAEADTQLGGLLTLVQALAQEAPRPLWLVTQGGTGGAMVPAMALALGRTIVIEHADLGCRRIDLDPSLTDPGGALAAELRAGKGEEWVRLGVAGREVPRVVPLRHRPARFSARPDAAYLVTGGFGGIGRAVAGWLVECGARDIVLMGRTLRDLPDADRWRRRGVRLRMIAADVADPAAVAVVLQSLDDDQVPLAGVLHAAGVTSDALLARQDPGGLAAALRAKAEGALVLHEATRGRDLDHFVLFSSIAALCGLVGTGAYAAANASLGALARRRRAEGLPALAVMWGTWNGSGMAAAADPTLATQWEAHGIGRFGADVGLAALGTLMASAESEAVAARVDWARLARWCREEGSGASLYARVAPAPEPPIGMPRPVAAPSSGELEAIVREAVAAVLDRSPADPMLDRPFGELGLGSLAAIELRNRLSARLGLPVPATLAFNHPSVTAVTRFLAGRLTPSASPAARHIGAMTEAEAERRVTALLDEIEAGRVA